MNLLYPCMPSRSLLHDILLGILVHPIGVVFCNNVALFTAWSIRLFSHTILYEIPLRHDFVSIRGVLEGATLELGRL